jgi:peptidoglycan/xylan/chitin deacetylase (PgdA/CDA1 family)
MSATPEVTKSSAASLARRIIKLGISIFYFVLCSLWNKLRRLSSKNRPGTAVVLYYHSVPRHYQARFEEQMRMITSRATPIALKNLDHLPADRHSVAITFDDALESFAENAVPVLQQLNIPATVFVVTDALGSRPAWGESYYDPEERVMSDEQLLNLPSLISVGSHTLTHPNLVALSEEVAAREITESRKKLESLLQRPITTFSFPHGESSTSTVRQCREAGYEQVFTIEPALLSADQPEFVAGRVAADPWDWGLEFKLKIAGAYCWQAYTRVATHKINQLFSPRRELQPQATECSTVERQWPKCR